MHREKPDVKSQKKFHGKGNGMRPTSMDNDACLARPRSRRMLMKWGLPGPHPSIDLITQLHTAPKAASMTICAPCCAPHHASAVCRIMPRHLRTPADPRRVIAFSIIPTGFSPFRAQKRSASV